LILRQPFGTFSHSTRKSHRSGKRILFNRLRLSRKILLGILPLFLVFISVSVIVQDHFQEMEMMEQAQAAAHTYSDIIKESLVSMMATNLEVDSSFLARLNAIQQFDTVHILVNDLRLRQELLTPTRVHRLETQYKTLSPHDSLEQQVLVTGQPMFMRDGDRFRGVIPFTATESVRNVTLFLWGTRLVQRTCMSRWRASRASWSRTGTVQC
jgi:hypothetical protein